jgi:hypothetical protein
MNDLIDQLFARAGQSRNGTHSAEGCPPDEAFAGYLAALLPAAQREALELHSLACADCHDPLRMVVDITSEEARLVVTPSRELVAAPVRAGHARLRIVGRLVQRGIELLNHAELTFRTVMDPLTPVLDPVRGAAAAAGVSSDVGSGAPATSEWISVRGPGDGLDELELQFQANGTAQLVVRCEHLPELQPGELASILLDVDGFAREKRPFSGEPLTFAPLGRGSYRVRLVARAPGGPARPLAEATLELTA